MNYCQCLEKNIDQYAKLSDSGLVNASSDWRKAICLKLYFYRQCQQEAITFKSNLSMDNAQSGNLPCGKIFWSNHELFLYICTALNGILPEYGNFLAKNCKFSLLYLEFLSLSWHMSPIF